MQVIFAGTPNFAATILQGLVTSRHHVQAVLTQPDRPAGRGKQLTASPVKRLAEEVGLSVLQPCTLRTEEALSSLRELAPEIMVVAAYGLLLPSAVLGVPRYGCINVHASLLPRWRGAAPIQRAIEAGDAETGVSIMAMDVGLDTGKVYLRQHCPLSNEDTAGSVHDRLARLGSDALLLALDGIESGQLVAQAQDDRNASYARKVEKHEARLAWQDDAVTLWRRVRAFNPTPVAWTELPVTRVKGAEARLRVLSAEPVMASCDEEKAPGTITRVTAKGIEVACGRGRLLLKSVQRAGRGRVSGHELAQALALAPGDTLT